MDHATSASEHHSESGEGAPARSAAGGMTYRRGSGSGRCMEHDVELVFDLDCYRCPVDNRPVGPAVRPAGA